MEYVSEDTTDLASGKTTTNKHYLQTGRKNQFKRLIAIYAINNVTINRLIVLRTE